MGAKICVRARLRSSTMACARSTVMGSMMGGVAMDVTGPAIGGFGGEQAAEYDTGDAALEKRGWVPKKGVVSAGMSL